MEATKPEVVKKATTKSKKVIKEVSQEMIDRDHLEITYSDNSKQVFLI